MPNLRNGAVSAIPDASAGVLTMHSSAVNSSDSDDTTSGALPFGPSSSLMQSTPSDSSSATAHETPPSSEF